MTDVEIRYCEGWDPAEKALVGGLPEAVARERDETGAEYAVAIARPDSATPSVLIEVCRRAHYFGVWQFDELGRRRARRGYRELADGRLFLLESEVWQYHSEAQDEFDKDAPHEEVQYEVSGRGLRFRGGGERAGLLQDYPRFDSDALFRAVPAFGDWAGLAGIDATRLRVAPVDAPAAERPWRAPEPLRPVGVDDMFRPGLSGEGPDGEAVAVAVVDGGRLVLPTGRLVAADPAFLMSKEEPFEATVPPGGYQVWLSMAVLSEDHQQVAGAKLVIRDEPALTWEPALRPRQDVRLLGDEQFYGVGVDGGMAAFYDAAAAGSLESIVEEMPGALFERVYEAAGAAEVVDPGSGANLIAFESGWGDGSYPVWLGRTAAGEVAAFVIDFLVLREVELR